MEISLINLCQLYFRDVLKIPFPQHRLIQAASYRFPIDEKRGGAVFLMISESMEPKILIGKTSRGWRPIRWQYRMDTLEFLLLSVPEREERIHPKLPEMKEIMQWVPLSLFEYKKPTFVYQRRREKIHPELIDCFTYFPELLSN